MTLADEPADRLDRVRRLALASFLLALAIVAISAYLRLHAAGFGCADWPSCYGEVLAGKPAAQGGVVRLLHRLGGSAALLLALVLLWRCLRPQPLQPAARYAAALVALMLALAVLGIWSADPRRVLVGFLNILGGLGLVSLSWRVVSATAAPAPAPRNPWLKPGLGALLATVVCGALIGARYAAVACPTVPFCGAGPWSADATLHLLHRGCALATLLLLGAAAHGALHRPEQRRAALVLLVLLVGEVLLGALTVASGFSLWFGVAHSVAAAGLLAAAASLRT